MQIPIKVSKCEGGTPEWYIIELQGTIETDNKDALPGRCIGDLHFTKQGEPVLIIGHHQLNGKEVKLEKPFLVMKKTPVDQNEISEHISGKLTYEVEGVVRRKLLFKSRPKPIVSNKIL